MEIFRLIFITLLMKCGNAVNGLSVCEGKTVSKFPDNQCLNDVEKTTLFDDNVSTTEENHFIDATTSNPNGFHHGMISNEESKPEISTEESIIDLQEGNKKGIDHHSSKVKNLEDSFDLRSDSKETIISEGYPAEHITIEAYTAAQYSTTEETTVMYSKEKSTSTNNSDKHKTEVFPRTEPIDRKPESSLIKNDELNVHESFNDALPTQPLLYESLKSYNGMDDNDNDDEWHGMIFNVGLNEDEEGDDSSGNNIRKERLYFKEDTSADKVILDDELVKDDVNGRSYIVLNNPPTSPTDFEQGMLNDEQYNLQRQTKQFESHKVHGGEVACSDCDLGILPVTATGSRGNIENSPFRQSHAIPEASIQFADVPPEKDLRVDDLGLAEGSFLFSYLGELLSWLQPNDFPVELMRNALKNQISIFDLITQSLKLEAGFIGCIAIGISLALAAPIVVLAHTCYRIRRKRDDEDQSPIGCAGNCRRRTLVFFLQIIIFLLLIGTVAMLITNQQVSTAVLQTGDVLKTVLDDLDAFLRNAHHQLHFVISKHLDQAVQAVNADLDGVEMLLGQPIQAELSRETGLDVALESLRDIAQDVSKVGESVELVQLAAGLLSEGIIMTTDKLSDLRLQVNSFRRQCSSRDQPLCDTLNVAGLEVTLRVDSLRQDDKLKRVRQIGGPELRGAVESARVLFRDIPRQVEAHTKESRQAVRRQLNQEQMEIDESIRSLESLVRSLTGKLKSGQNTLDDIIINIPELEFWRWIIGLGAAGSLALLWILLQLGISCGCCGSEKSAGPTLLICVILICLLSTVLWLLAILVFVIGGHGQAFICRPLYQEPEFPALSQLLDNPGLFPNSHKFISTMAFDNGTIDVPFNKVLKECHENKPVYPVFKLNGVFNVESMTETRKWDRFRDKLDNIQVKLDYLKLLSPTLQNQLNDLLQGLSVNLTAHRTYLSNPVTGKDLNSFAAQLESVGNQIKDLATASRMETLASRARRLIATHIEPLKEKKNNLLYQLTTLEVQLNPLQRQVEQSISHFKTIQFFIDNQGNSIANKKVKEYIHRLMRYIDQYKSNLSDRINNNLATCQPLWKLFHTSRLMLCKHVMDPLNGFWFSTVWCLVILLCATPVCLKLVDCYKKKSQVLNQSSSSPTENLMSNENGRDWGSNGANDSNGGW